MRQTRQALSDRIELVGGPHDGRIIPAPADFFSEGDIVSIEFRDDGDIVGERVYGLVGGKLRYYPDLTAFRRLEEGAER